MKHENQREYMNENTGRLQVETINNEPSMTQQQFKDECDINNIMKKYTSTGEFLHKTSKQGIFADFTEIKDYQQMCDTVLYAEQAFSSLPAEVRSRFRNNPGELLTFIQDSKNYDEAQKLGLVNPKPTATPPNDQTKTNDPQPTATPPSKS